MVVGTYRSNEVGDDDDLMQNIDMIKQSANANATVLKIDELTNDDINEMISEKLCLPLRYTQELADQVVLKTNSLNQSYTIRVWSSRSSLGDGSGIV